MIHTGLPVLAASLLAAGLAGCGGDDNAKTVTVAAPPAPAPASTTPPPAGDTTTSAAPATDTAPPDDLPAGAIAVQGRFKMTLLKNTTSGFAFTGETLNKGDARVWVAETTCESTCQVRLRRQLASGSFENAVLDQDPDDPAKYASTKTIEASYCLNGKTAGPVTKRISLKVTKTSDVDGKRVAARMDGYLSVKQRCRLADGDDPTPSSAVVQFRGAPESG